MESYMERLKSFMDMKTNNLFRSAALADLALLFSVPVLIWMMYVQYYFPARLPMSYAMSPVVFCIVWVVYRVKIHDVFGDAVLLKVETTDAKLDMFRKFYTEAKRSSLVLCGLSIVQLVVFFGYVGNNLDRILIIPVVISAVISLISFSRINGPDDISSYRSLFYLRSEHVRNILTRLANIFGRS